MVFPFIWQLVTSFKTMATAVRVPPTLLPDPWIMTNYAEVFDSVPFGQMFANSVMLTLGRTGLLYFGWIRLRPNPVQGT